MKQSARFVVEEPDLKDFDIFSNREVVRDKSSQDTEIFPWPGTK
jgi:hypothetical protein